VADQTNTASRSFPDGWQVEPEVVGLDCAPPPDANYDAVPRQRLPPSPYRSLGGYLNYAGWSERERFMELDRAIQRQVHAEPSDIDDQASSDGPLLPIPVRRSTIRESHQSANTVTPDDAHLEWKIAGQIDVFVKSSNGWTTGQLRRL